MIVTTAMLREHLAASSLGPEDDALVTGYLASAKSWVRQYLNIDALPAETDPRSPIIRQAILLAAGQFFLQREEILPNFHRRSFLTAERLLNGIRARQLGAE